MRTTTNKALLTLTAWAALSTAALAQEQQGGEGEFQREVAVSDPSTLGEAPAQAIGPLRIYAGLRLGFAGELELDFGDEVIPGGPDTVSDDATVTIGIQAGADYVVMKYFAIGGELRLGWFNTENADDAGTGRSMLFDIDVKPKGMYAFDKMPLELYAAIPIGVTFPSFNDDWNADANVGWNWGIGVGANYFFTENIGVNAELAWIMHYFSADGSGLGGEVDASLGQLNIFANFVYAL